VRLDPGEAERIAAIVAEAVRRDPPAPFLDAAATARMLSVERDWVYEHAEELGRSVAPDRGGACASTGVTSASGWRGRATGTWQKAASPIDRACDG
jgi:hypothetical protein